MESYYNNRLFDVVVIGGGIAGLGVAIECASRGFDTIVLERDRICSATSRNSLRIIHGGFRYLQHINLLRVVESLKDQTRILKEAPSLVKLLPCVMPLQRFGFKSRGPMELAAGFYNALCEQVVGQRSRASVISDEFVQKHVQLLRGHAPYGAFLWYDARVRDPHKFAQLMRHKIDKEGGEIAENIKVTNVRREQKVFIVSCQEGGEQSEVCGRIVVNASGPWMGEVGLEGVAQRKKPNTWCRAFNVILNKKLQERFAVAQTSPRGRLFFTVPRAEVSTIGTGYLPMGVDTDPAHITEEEVQVFLQEFNQTFHEVKLTLSDIREVESGVQPARSISDDGKQIKLYGRAKIWDYNGFMDLLTTKYTTFHAVGHQVLRRALRYLR